MAEVLLLGEMTGEGLDPITGELLAAGRSLGQEVAVALMGDGVDRASAEAISLGADRVYLVQHPLLVEPSTDARVAAFEQVCRQTSPAVVLVGNSPAGRDIGPRVAFRLDVGLAQDCVEVKLDPGTNRVVATRPVYGGNALATVTFAEADPQMVILRGGTYAQLPPDPYRTGKVVPTTIQINPSVVKVRHVKTVHRQNEGARLEEASVVVCGGRGLGGPEPFTMLRELAELLGGAVGASRAACDAGWLSYSYQIGLTGKRVAPDLYIAVAVSGASQHITGCSGARHIVAVNHDPDANIFKEATYGVVANWRSVLPTFIKTVRELTKS